MTIDRNPDINLTNGDTVPDGCYIQKGKWLQDVCRQHKIPFGVCRERLYYEPGTQKSRLETIGLVIRLEDKKRILAGIKLRKAAKLVRGERK